MIIFWAPLKILFIFPWGHGVTGAAVHDSVPCLSLVPDKPAYPDQEFFGDSAYSSKEINTKVAGRGFVPLINERAGVHINYCCNLSLSML